MFLGVKQTTCWRNTPRYLWAPTPLKQPYQINHRDGAWRLTSTYWNHRDIFLGKDQLSKNMQKPQTQSLTVFLNLFVFTSFRRVVRNKIKRSLAFCEFYRHSDWVSPVLGNTFSTDIHGSIRLQGCVKPHLSWGPGDLGLPRRHPAESLWGKTTILTKESKIAIWKAFLYREKWWKQRKWPGNLFWCLRRIYHKFSIQANVTSCVSKIHPGNFTLAHDSVIVSFFLRGTKHRY